jgi:uncharacterized protein (TIGR02147 family)
MKAIYHYRDYRKALRDFYENKKLQSSGYTYARFSRAANLGSPNYLKIVIDGRRDLTISNIHSFANVIGLKGPEIEYFEALVLENQADQTSEKRYYSRKLSQIKKSNETRVVRKKSSAVFDEAMMPAVLLCSVRNSEEDAVTKVRHELRMESTKAKQLISELLKSGELKIDDQQKLSFPDRHTMIHDPHSANEKQKRFLKQALNEAQSTFDTRYHSGTAKFLSILMTAPEKSLPEIFALLKASVEKVSDAFDPGENEPSGVYRVQFQAYRLLDDL